jgi:hypothetical protein
VELEERSSCGCLVLEVLERTGRAGWLAVVAVVASTLPLCAVPAVAVGMMTGDVVTADFGQLQPLVPCSWKVRPRELLPVSDGALSPPAISSRLEMDGSEGLCSSAGGEGGDWISCRWYCWSAWLRCRGYWGEEELDIG